MNEGGAHCPPLVFGAGYLAHMAWTGEVRTRNGVFWKRADFVVLGSEGFSDDAVLDAWLFSSDNAAIRTVYCGGVPVVQNGRHKERERLSERYRKALAAKGH